MWTTHNFAARTLIWLAVIAIPMQSLPASTCECSKDERCCQDKLQSGGCCLSSKAHGHRRCGDEDATLVTKTCCGNHRIGHDSPCKCGVNCQCSKSRPSKPIAPAVEKNATKNVVNETVSMVAVHCPGAVRGFYETSAAGDALAGLNVCISLCRFTL